ncbi:MAG: phage recombination protein Bet [Filomicrobium sp.]
MGELAVQNFSDKDLKLIRQTVARELESAEFDLFVHMCKRWRLDPCRRQIYANVYKRNKKNQDGSKETVRNVVYVTGIDGYRTIADRTGCYRPGQRSTEVDKDIIDKASNPQGIVSATASVWKFTHGEWHEFSERVYWEEFAPLKEIWEFCKTKNKKAPSGKFELDRSGNWAKMGRVMLQKCAEAQALRRGWPDEYGDLYTHEEMDHQKVIDVTPTEQVEQAMEAERTARMGGPAILIDWMDSSPLQSVPATELHGRVRDFIQANVEEPMTILSWRDRNREALRQFWAVKPDETLDLKKLFERYELTARNQGLITDAQTQKPDQGREDSSSDSAARPSGSGEGEEDDGGRDHRPDRSRSLAKAGGAGRQQSSDQPALSLNS